jgi:DNA-binding response OmpR family regulator
MEDNSHISILIAEDDLNLGLVVKDFLSLSGYNAVLCRDGEEAIEVFRNLHFNICVLDVMMPKKDGFTLAREIRSINPDIPVIFLTAKSLHEDLMKGFRIGCDDYITKPFSTEELNFRIKAVLKRCSNITSPSLLGSQVVMVGAVEFDMSNLLLRTKDGEKHLTRKEAELLKVLFDNKNRILKRDVLTSEIWKQNNYFAGRSMDVFIARLRKYLSSDPAVSIVNVHGSGFKLQIDEDESQPNV